MKVNIVIPIYNEEKVLEKSVGTLLSFLRDSKFPYEYDITIAINGSEDRSLEIANKLSSSNKLIRVMSISGKGKGLAIKSAWDESDARVFTFMDVDLASDLNFFLPLVNEIVLKNYDMTTGNRLGVKSIVISNKRLRKISSHIFNFLARLLFNSGLNDHQCGFKAISKDAYMGVRGELKEKGWLFDTELITILIRHGYKIGTIDIVWRDGNESKVSLLKDSWKMFTGLLSLKYRLR